MSKNILIRNLTDRQNERLLQLQKKFGIKTNSQALLMLLDHCVFVDDELTTLMELYEQFGMVAFEGMKLMDGTGQQEKAEELETLVKASLNIANKLSSLLKMRRK